MPAHWWAHRGAGKGPEENTLKSFETARQRGFRQVEFDVMLTLDGQPFVHHDWLMGRCAKPKAGSLGSILPAFQLLSAQDLSGWTVGGEPIPSLSEVLIWCAQQGMVPNVELKATSPRQAVALGHAVCKAYQSVVANHPQAICLQNSVFSSFYHASLLPLQGYSLALLYEQLPDNWVLNADALGANAVHLGAEGLNAEDVRRVHCTGRSVRVYTVNTFDEAQKLLEWGVSGLFTDRMDLPDCFESV